MRSLVIGICALALVFGMAGFARAQQATTRSPDCLVSFRFTAAGSAANPGGTAPYFDNRGSACTIWTLSYQSTGFSAVSIQADEAPLLTTGDAVGTFIVWPSAQLYSGSLPLTTTTVAGISMFGYHPFIRVTLNSKTGTGVIYGTLLGWRNTAGDATTGGSGGGGGSVTQGTSPWVVGGTVTITSTSANVITVLGNTAIGATYSGNPVNIACKGVSSEQTAVTTGQEVNCVSDLVGKLIVIPYANPENFVNGTALTITDTTSTTTMASAGGSLRNYVTNCVLSNSHATVATIVQVLDGSTVLFQVYLAALGGGGTFTFPVPWKGTAATAVNIKPVTTGANILGSCNGYKGL